jgi:hypothetical protein
MTHKHAYKHYITYSPSPTGGKASYVGQKMHDMHCVPCVHSAQGIGTYAFSACVYAHAEN